MVTEGSKSGAASAEAPEGNGNEAQDQTQKGAETKPSRKPRARPQGIDTAGISGEAVVDKSVLAGMGSVESGGNYVAPTCVSMLIEQKAKGKYFAFSTTKAAKALGVTVTTIEAAISRLRDEGIVEVRRRALPNKEGIYRIVTGEEFAAFREAQAKAEAEASELAATDEAGERKVEEGEGR